MNFRMRPASTPVVTAAEQKRIDNRAFAGGVPERSLMESAGRSAADYILREFVETLPTKTFAVIAGSGGNGGDAVVVARLLFEAGYTVETYLAVPPENMSKAAAFHARELIGRTPGNVHRLADSPTELSLMLDPELRSAGCIVDGLFGSGTSRPACGRFAAIIDAVNRSPAKVISLDLPSGIRADGGVLDGPAVVADETVAMHFLKPANVLYPARQRCGRITVIEVAYPEQVAADVRPIAVVPGLKTLRAQLPERPPTGHKGRFGRVLVLAGSRGMTGAAILCCRAALRAGAGTVTLACPASLEPVFETALPEVITAAVPDRDGTLAGVDTPRFRDLLDAADAMVVGPGLSRHPAVTPIVERLVAEVPVPLVLDADGLWPFRGRPERIARAEGERILTPHPGEMARLLDLPIEEIEDARWEIARETANISHATVVFKGVPTVISSPADAPPRLTMVGNHGLASGGSGDVLTGLIAGLAAQKIPPRDAACLGAYLHAACADTYAETRSARSLLPSDVVEMLPHVLYSLEHGLPSLSNPPRVSG